MRLHRPMKQGRALMILMVAASALFAGCGADEVIPPVEPPPDPAEPDSVSPYPIHVEYWRCDSREHCDMERISPTRMPTQMRAGALRAIQEWSWILAPTEPVSYRIPAVEHFPYQWECYYIGEIGKPGEQMRPGLTIHLVYRDKEENPIYAGAAGFCGYQYPDASEAFEFVWESDKPPMGMVFLPYLDYYTSDDWYEVVLHEIGHVAGVLAGRIRWRDHFVEAVDGSAGWVTAPEVVKAFDDVGGTHFPGKKVPTDASGDHWHQCIAKGDRMAGGPRMTSLSLRVMWPGLKYMAQGGLDDDHADRWADCPVYKPPLISDINRAKAISDVIWPDDYFDMIGKERRSAGHRN